MKPLKIAVFQFNPIVGDLSGNTDKLIDAINQAKQNQCDLFISTELAISGYPPEDLLLRSDFYMRSEEQLERLNTITGITLVIGAARQANKLNYNSAYVIRDGQNLGIYDKQLFPNYGVFDEKRYFKSGNTSLVFTCQGVKIGIVICEDIWGSEPARISKHSDAELLCVINASPYEIDKHNQRLSIVNERVSELNIPILYVNQYGGQDELIFDGASFAVNPNKTTAMQLPAFQEKLSFLSYDLAKFTNGEIVAYPDTLESIYNALVVAVQDYVNKNGIKGVLLGLSGGIDSALTLAIAVDALGKDRVIAVMMPSKYTADISVIDSREMVKRLGVRYEEIEISSIFEQFKQQLNPIFTGMAEDTTEENLQARSRGTLLMAISNKLGYLVLTTGNKSEMTTGYATLYGDMAGGFAVLKDVLKTQVYELSKWRNQKSEVIPTRIITRHPSAELRDNQTDQDSLPDYDTLDRIIDMMVHKSLSSTDIIQTGIAVDAVNKVARLLKLNEHKRRQAAVGPKINQIAFAKDWRYPITSRFTF